MQIPDVGAIIRTNYNPAYLTYRVVRIHTTPEGTLSFICHLADDPSGRQGKRYLNGYRVLGERLVGTQYGPGTALWQAMYGRDNATNPEAGDGYSEIVVESYAAQQTLFGVGAGGEARHAPPRTVPPAQGELFV